MGQWRGIRNGKSYKLSYPNDICNKLEYIYSSNTNDYWETGTCRRHTKLNVKNYSDYGFWTPFREGLTVKGRLVEDNIEVDWKHHQIKAKEDAKRDIKSTKRKS